MRRGHHGLQTVMFSWSVTTQICWIIENALTKFDEATNLKADTNLIGAPFKKIFGSIVSWEKVILKHSHLKVINKTYFRFRCIRIFLWMLPNTRNSSEVKWLPMNYNLLNLWYWIHTVKKCRLQHLFCKKDYGKIYKPTRETKLSAK